MDSGKITLLTQLISNLKESFVVLGKAYNESDKEKFEISKKAILEMQHKIEFLMQ